MLLLLLLLLRGRRPRFRMLVAALPPRFTPLLALAGRGRAARLDAGSFCHLTYALTYLGRLFSHCHTAHLVARSCNCVARSEHGSVQKAGGYEQGKGGCELSAHGTCSGVADAIGTPPSFTSLPSCVALADQLRPVCDTPTQPEGPVPGMGTGAVGIRSSPSPSRSPPAPAPAPPSALPPEAMVAETQRGARPEGVD